MTMDLDIADLMRQGIEQSESVTGLLMNERHEKPPQACAYGAAKVASDEARFAAIREHCCNTHVDVDTLPKQPDIDHFGVWVRTGQKISLQLAITALNDGTDLNREAIAEWVSTLPDEKRVVTFTLDDEGAEEDAVAA